MNQNIFRRYIASFSYISMILLINVLFVYLPGVSAFGQSFSPADMMVGCIYIVRDFAQREIKHYIFIAMLVGAGLSYLLANQEIALASLAAFLVGETIDWAIFSFTKKPLSQRLIWSSALSSPIDSWVFLAVAHRLHLLEFTMMTLGKIIGILVLWLIWKKVAARKSLAVS